jgi:galactosamine-6-phosphate isomerase
LNVVTCENYERLSLQGAALVIAAIEQKPDLLLCAATGNSPIGLYRELARKAATGPGLFRSLRAIELDEWGGLRDTDDGSATRYLRERLLNPLAISADRFMAFDSATDPSEACRKMRSELERSGPIDLCVLGLGMNGHIGFNEPGPSLVPDCHVARLSEETRRHAMTRSMSAPPEFGLTLGMKEILASRQIVLLVTGAGKERTLTRLLTGEVATTLPASLLWLHGNVECFVDQTVLHGRNE